MPPATDDREFLHQVARLYWWPGKTRQVTESIRLTPIQIYVKTVWSQLVGTTGASKSGGGLVLSGDYSCEERYQVCAADTWHVNNDNYWESSDQFSHIRKASEYENLKSHVLFV